MTDVTDDDTEPIIPALREWGPDVGDPPDAKTRDYIHPELERQVMEAIARYPQSRIREDGTVHGLAAVAAITTVEKWLLAHEVDPARYPSSAESSPTEEPT